MQVRELFQTLKEVPEEIQEKTMATTSGMQKCRRRRKFRKHDCDVQHAGMQAPEEIQENIVDVAKVSGILVWVK